MEVVAEPLISAAIDFLFKQLASNSDLIKFAREEHVHAQLKNWQTVLVGIRKKLSHAEEKQITDDNVKSWLNELRTLVYDMEDVLDELAYHVMRRKLMAPEADQPSTCNQRLTYFIRTCRTHFNPRLLKMRAKIQNINGRLLDISDPKGTDHVLKEVIGDAPPAWRRPAPTTPVLLANELEVYGRDMDKKAILHLLGKVGTSDLNFGVVSIVGAGGLGKTTLAKLVYNDVEVAQNFELKAWACVSDVFDVVKIMKSILNSPNVSGAGDSHDLQQLQLQLRDAFTNKKFLLILDDVWNKNLSNWDCLWAVLAVGAQGSKVIVTTRDRDVALKMGASENLHPLTHLSQDACWSVFEKQAFKFRNEVDRRELEPIGREIVTKCHGFPLAAKSLGGLLCSKRTEEEWKRILNSKIWELPSTECDIFPVLFFSYYDLPSCLKRCFAYCAIFPKDYEFDPKTLVLLWMAEGFLEQPNSNSQTMEERGNEYLRELVSKSFFQSSGNHESHFLMHDLIHDLARLVFKGICACLEDNIESNQQSQIPSETRHLSFTHGKFLLFRKLEDVHMLQCLRTFVALLDYHETNLIRGDLMSKFQQLRALSLSGCMIYVLSNSIGGLKHLRYLDLSSTHIESLPDSMTNFCNLQTLILYCCEHLTRLPIGMGNMISLRHLNIDGCPSQDMPQQIGKLKQLRTLSNFIVGKEGCLGIKELRDLSHLNGKIEISQLENVLNVQDARDANLRDKLNIETLSMSWYQELDGSCDEDVLSSLEPNINLKNLSIFGYGGTKFPNWISDPSYSKLVSITLSGCVKCKSLPSVGELPSLKELTVRMVGVESIGLEFEGQVSLPRKPFQCLEYLCFEEMFEWRVWSWSSESFPSLRVLEITVCPILVGKLPIHLTSLEELDVSYCPEMQDPLPTDLCSFQKLKSYSCYPNISYYQETGGGESANNVTSCLDLQVGELLNLSSELKQWPSVELVQIENPGRLRCEWVDGFRVGNLETLKISGYKQLESLGKEEKNEEHGLPINLRSLQIEDCESLTSLPGWILMRNNSSCPLEELKISNCPSLVCFPRGQLTPTLKVLEIQDCENLASLPEDMGTNCALEAIEIQNCPLLVGFPKGPFAPALKRLKINNCEKLASLPEHMNKCALEVLEIDECPSLVGFPDGGLPPTLKRLSICRCEKLGSLPEGIMHDHDSYNTIQSGLQDLCIEDCSSLMSFPSGKFPSSLNSLWIVRCLRLPPFSNEMFDCNDNSLDDLFLGNYHNLKTLPGFLYNIKCLRIWGCKNLELQPPQFRSLTSLASLQVSDCENIKTPLADWGLAGLASLTELIIGHISQEATTFSGRHNHGHLPILPTTLEYLKISGFKTLESLAILSLQTLTSLKSLYISDFPKLRSFIPKQGLPHMLSRLEIEDCPLLELRCSKETGEDWSKIVHIRDLQIGSV